MAPFPVTVAGSPGTSALNSWWGDLHFLRRTGTHWHAAHSCFPLIYGACLHSEIATVRCENQDFWLPNISFKSRNLCSEASFSFLFWAVKSLWPMYTESYPWWPKWGLDEGPNSACWEGPWVAWHTHSVHLELLKCRVVPSACILGHHWPNRSH